jgi:hypothetical protein
MSLCSGISLNKKTIQKLFIGRKTVRIICPTNQVQKILDGNLDVFEENMMNNFEELKEEELKEEELNEEESKEEEYIDLNK